MTLRRITRFAAVASLVAVVAAGAVLPAGAGQTTGTTPPNRAVRVAVPFEALKAGFVQPDMIYAPFMFWFWDEPLDTAKLAEMARVMMSEGYSPGYVHARRSMVKTPDLPDKQWLGPEWFDAFDATIKETDARKNYVGFCDEYWWPSLQANGRILRTHPELEAVSLRWDVMDVKGGTKVDVPSAFFVTAARLTGPIPEGGFPVNTAKDVFRHAPATIRSATLSVLGSNGAPFAWTAPAEGDWRVYVFNAFPHAGFDDGKTNSIDDRLAPVFIREALEPYAKRLGDKLGTSIPGDFIDNEGDYGWQLAWSGTLDRRYRERYGRDIRLWMPLMIDADAEGAAAKTRWEWFDLVSDIYAGNFRAVTDWNEARGMYTTIHVWEEGIPPQLSGVGDHMKFLRAVTMPGQDCLGRKPLRVHDFKEIESVAEFGGVRAATELMGAGGFEGTPWNTFNPPFLKQAANAVTAWGMSHVIPHAVFATRKLEGNPWPPDWYSESPSFPWMHLWTDFVRRASYVNSMGTAVPDVLLFNPMESAWVNADATILDMSMWTAPEGHAGGRRINAIEKAYAGAIDDLTAARVEFLVGDRFYLKQMMVDDGVGSAATGGAGAAGPALTRGPLAFRTVVLPPMDVLTLGSAKTIVDFAKAGGRVYALGELPGASAENGADDPQMAKLMGELKAAATFAACEGGLKARLDRGDPGLVSPVRFETGAFAMLQHRRRIDGREFFWLANNGAEARECRVLVAGARGAASIWDCETGTVRAVASADAEGGAGSRLELAFEPYEAYWLVFDPSKPATGGAPERLPKVARSSAVDGPWTVSYDAKLQPVMEFPVTPAKEFAAGVVKPLEDWKAWGLEKFSGVMDYVASVNVKAPTAGLMLDLGRVGHSAEVIVNGTSCGARLWGPFVYDIGAALKPGRNRIRVRVANSISNSYGEVAESGLLGPVRLLRY